MPLCRKWVRTKCVRWVRKHRYSKWKHPPPPQTMDHLLTVSCWLTHTLVGTWQRPTDHEPSTDCVMLADTYTGRDLAEANRPWTIYWLCHAGWHIHWEGPGRGQQTMDHLLTVLCWLTHTLGGTWQRPTDHEPSTDCVMLADTYTGRDLAEANRPWTIYWLCYAGWRIHWEGPGRGQQTMNHLLTVSCWLTHTLGGTWQRPTDHGPSTDCVMLTDTYTGRDLAEANRPWTIYWLCHAGWHIHW